MRLLLLALLVPVSPGHAAAAWESCLVIAHRGASGYLPEHTLPAYRLAIQLGADFIEPDLVQTRDGVLVARHDVVLSSSTNVADLREFSGKRRRRTVGATEIDDWFVDDFTLAELQRLRARETRPAVRPGNTVFDNAFGISTFAEVIGLASEEGLKRGRPVGIYPELKEPAWFRGRGLDPEQALIAALGAGGIATAGSPVFIQSFDAESLRRLRPLTPLPLIQLVEAHDDLDLAAIARYAQGVGAPKQMIFSGSSFVTAARAAGLEIHGWTFRAENTYLEARFQRGSLPSGRGNLAGEIDAALKQGMVAFFTDQPDVGRAVCDRRREPPAN